MLYTFEIHLLHPKDMVNIVLPGICKMINISCIRLNLVDADILVDEQSPKAVLAHQRIVFEYAKLRKVCKLLRGMKDFIRKLSCIRSADFRFVVFQKGQKLIPRLI